ncbi:MAG: magnesium transporter CorA family protein [Polaromonas sp.]|nr:magnesium transporter CorA family protein [Polaromonas sp.]
MQIVEFTDASLRFVDAAPEQPPRDGFVWVFLDQQEFEGAQTKIQQAAIKLGGSALLDLHCQDLASPVHPSHYDSTSIYDLIIFRRLATQLETQAEDDHEKAIRNYHGQERKANKRGERLPTFNRISSKAVGFAVFDRCLISVHPPGCYTAKSFIQRFLADAKFSLGASGADPASARSRLPISPADLALRMINGMVDSYLDLRKVLSNQLEHWQADLLRANSRFDNWWALMTARSQLHVLEDLCDEQHDAMQEWLDSLREQPLVSFMSNDTQAIQTAQLRRDQLVARARDVMEHIERVTQHARRLEQSAETVVQIHFNAQSNRTNDIMRTLTAVTAIFLPLNLITGFFGMNFEHIPGLHSPTAFWLTLGFMVLVVVVVLTVFLRKRYIARTGL